MKQLDEETALGILFGNTKKKKRTADLLTLAKSCKFLVDKYGSRKIVAQKLGLSAEMIREILLPLQTPKEIQDLISERKIDSIDVVREIASLKLPSKQVEAGYALLKIPTKDVRDIKRLIKESGVTIDEAKEIILDLKPQGLHIFIIDFDDKTYEVIRTQAKKLGFSPAILVKGLIQSWLRFLELQEKEL